MRKKLLINVKWVTSLESAGRSLETSVTEVQQERWPLSKKGTIRSARVSTGLRRGVKNADQGREVSIRSGSLGQMQGTKRGQEKYKLTTSSLKKEYGKGMEKKSQANNKTQRSAKEAARPLGNKGKIKQGFVSVFITDLIGQLGKPC